jgi:triosephosphate isomerase
MKKERKLIIAGNWKMNKTVAEALDLVRDLKTELATIEEVDIVVFPPFTALSEVAKVVHGSNIHLGAQNMSEHNIGAHTGEIAAQMLKELSVRYVILGHSERRQYQKESDELISKKAQAAHAASIQPIICVGETLAEHEAGRMEKVLETQVCGSLMAWAKIRSSTVLLPMNRSGRSAPARRPRRLKRKKRTSSSADYSSSCLTSQSLGASESNMVAVSIHPIRASSRACRTWTARW